MSQTRSYNMLSIDVPGTNVRVALKIAKGGDGLGESGLNPELESTLTQIREDYQKYKIEERMTKAKRKRRHRIKSSFFFLALTGLLMVLQFKGLISIGTLVEKFKLFS